MARKWALAAAAALGGAAVWWLVYALGERIVPVTPPTSGISRELAEARAANISAVRYALSLRVPRDRREPIRGNVSITVRLGRPAPIVIDFNQPADRVSSVRANDSDVPVHLEHGHIIVPAEVARRGENVVQIAFAAGDGPLNRSDDFLYSLFVPARASHAFPCFDQPDLKGSLSLTLDIPSDWTAVSNSPEVGRETNGDSLTLRFGPTPALPTYLFGFAAGRFSVERGERAGRTITLYHRETDADKVAENLPAIFDLHQHALEWLESYTGRPYPFQKLDAVLLPAFQFSGMEHAGAIYYNAPALFLDKTATQNQRLNRANLIAHETAHMWFGDLVTMKWFDDVWLKEVFANFMAAKIVNPSFPEVDHELRFFLQHYPQAYRVDRTAGTNPIRQPLDNLEHAGSLYGPIIYLKAPIVIRQLEQMMGADELRDGLREYLSRFAFANATWADLIDILDRRTPEDLAAWSRVWVDEPGRPAISTQLELRGGNIARLSFEQSDPAERGRLWPQQLGVALGYEHGARISSVKLQGRTAEVSRVEGLPVPRYVLPNAEGSGYGLFRLDAGSRRYFLEHLPEVGDGLTRGTAWVTLWDDMLEAGTPPREMFGLALRMLEKETDELNTARVLADTVELYWRYLTADERREHASTLEAALRTGLDRAATTSLKSAYFAAFRRTATTPAGVDYLRRVWQRAERIPGLTFAETDDIEMAQELALREPPDAAAIANRQLAAIANPDRKERFAFVMPALSADPAVRETFFASLARRENRARERWAAEGLGFLNHPLRRAHAERFIRPGLDMLAEIQRTGDIFFPLDWTAALLDGHNTASAAKAVTDFLTAQKEYPDRLRRVVAQTADPLFRSARITAQARQ